LIPVVAPARVGYKGLVKKTCPDCALVPQKPLLDRRRFLRAGSAAWAAAAATSILPWGAVEVVGATPPNGKVSPPTSETLVTTLYHSLTPEQRALFCLPFEHARRQDVDNAWYITKARIGKDLTRDQQQMVREIFVGLHHPDYAQRVLQATEHDAGEKGLGECSVALFGEPGSGKFEFVLSGRHVTRRCDGDSVQGAAFGGPIFYGHAPLEDDESADHPQNVYWYQAKRANEVFQMLNGKQRAVALLNEHRKEQGKETVRLSGKKTGLPGISFADLSRDQREHVLKVMGDLLAPFRPADAEEAMKLVKEAGLDHLHLAFFRSGDIGKDGVWDIWQIEGPSMVWYFRGSPHVHAWVNIRDHAEA